MKGISFLTVVTVLLIDTLALSCAANDSQATFQSAEVIYTQSVEFANEWNYTAALNVADHARAMNVTSLVPLIQSNRAGILVMLHMYDEAITAADASLAVEGAINAVHSVALYNKGKALRVQGRIPAAKEA